MMGTYGFDIKRVEIGHGEDSVIASLKAREGG